MSPRIHARLCELETQLLETEAEAIDANYMNYRDPAQRKTMLRAWWRARCVKQAIWWLTGVRR